MASSYVPSVQNRPMTSKVRPLGDGYRAEFTRCTDAQWRQLIEEFDDANLYQTWAYDAARYGPGSLQHCLVLKDGRVVAAAQARLAKVPGVPVGAAYVRWAPLWRRRGADPDPTALRMALRALRNWFVLDRGLLLRVFPLLYDSESLQYESLLAEEDYSAVPDEAPQRTLLLSLEPPLEDIRRNLEHKWRNRLSRAERNELQCIDGTGDELFETFVGLYRSLLARKRFRQPNDIAQFRNVQRRLGDAEKMRIFLSGRDGVFSCGVICSAVGDTGVYLFGACSAEGLQTNGSYLNQWKAIEWLKAQGCRHYNLNGINPQSNPGTYHFKAGLAGRAHRDVRYLGRFDSSRGSVRAGLVQAGARTARTWAAFLKRGVRRADRATGMASTTAGQREEEAGS